MVRDGVTIKPASTLLPGDDVWRDGWCAVDAVIIDADDVILTLRADGWANEYGCRGTSLLRVRTVVQIPHLQVAHADIVWDDGNLTPEGFEVWAIDGGADRVCTCIFVRDPSTPWASRHYTGDDLVLVSAPPVCQPHPDGTEAVRC